MVSLCLPSTSSMMAWQMCCMCSSTEQSGRTCVIYGCLVNDAEEDGPLLHGQKLDPPIATLHFTHKNEESQNFRVRILENLVLVSFAEKQVKNVRIFAK